MQKTTGITKPYTHLHPPPSTSTQLISASTQLSATPSIIFEPKYCRMLILNPDLDFWNFDPKIHFWANLGPKTQSCPFCLKIGTHGISRMLILIPTLVFWISNPNLLFGQIWAKKFWLLSVLTENWHRWYLEDADSYANISFMNFQL